MSRLCLLFVILHLSFSGAIAQRISRQRISRSYQNLPLSAVLKDLNTASSRYEVSFIYNELEDFRVTTTLHRATLPDAVRQVVGFYPMRVTETDSMMIVECIHKTDRHLTGTIIDEQGQPVAYANVSVLNPADSTLLSGGVSNESGYFAVPYETPPPIGGGREGAVLARISCIGYKTVYKLCDKPEVGTVRMHPDNYIIKGVVVQGERPKVQLQGNSLMMNVEGTVMERLGTAEDVLSRVPTISKKGEGYEILGKGAPQIYLNNRKLTDLNELRNIQSDFIRTVEVIQNPGARYDATVTGTLCQPLRRL